MLNTPRFVVVVLALALVGGLAWIGLAGSPAADASPVGAGGAQCRLVHLPSVVVGGSSFNGGPSGPGQGSPTGLDGTCDGFPDFNGDGYADLAIGIPDEDVFGGVFTWIDAGAVQVIYGTTNGLNAYAAQNPIDDQIWHRAVDGVPGILEEDDQFGAAMAMGDFNRDGFDDLAIGVPGAVDNGLDGSGAVNVIYGSASGLSAEGIQQWSQNSAGIASAPETDDHFGAALAAGDFNGDGYADLAIGSADEDVEPFDDAGAVHVIFGGPGGLTAAGSEIITQDTPGFLASSAETDDRFGFSLVAADFDGDGVDDLAASAPFEDIDGLANTGIVAAFYGIAGEGLLSGNSLVNMNLLNPDSPYIEGVMEANDRFGFSLAAADFNGDGLDDLAVGIPFETHGTGPGAIQMAGALNVFLATQADRLAPTVGNVARIWHQDVDGVEGDPASLELFGYDIAAGDFNHDGYADLAVGVPLEQVLTVPIGAVQIFFSTGIGPVAVSDYFLYDPDNPADGDQFGLSVEAGDFNGDGYIDLAAGAPRDDPVGLGLANVGSVFAFTSDAGGVQLTLNDNWYQGYNGLAGDPEAEDHLAEVLP